ncbi:hypothetical protein TNCV_421691 [Trichonephila clavipes]|nr:hypothetical protein TNCV_421691 [Trichonephila clavipes]
MYSSALSIEIISDVEFSRRLVESRSDKLKQVKSQPVHADDDQYKKQLNSSVGTKQLNLATWTKQLSRRKQLKSAAGTNNSTRQQERTTQLGSKNETTRLCTAYNHLQPPTTACNRLQPPATAYNRLQPPATACTAFTAESAFSIY